MTDYCCMNCTTKEKGNTQNMGSGYSIITCNDCGMIVRFYVMQPPTKTNEEADESFSKTPLKDSQRYGGANTGKYKRKRKRKTAK